jgi:hypothetical protein
MLFGVSSVSRLKIINFETFETFDIPLRNEQSDNDNLRIRTCFRFSCFSLHTSEDVEVNKAEI